MIRPAFEQIKTRLLLGIVVSCLIAVFSMATIARPVPLPSLLMIGCSRLIYCVLIWTLYSFIAVLMLQYRVLNFLLFVSACVLLVLPLIPYTLWVNSITGGFYPPFVRDAGTIEDHRRYYFHFYLLRAFMMGVPVYLVQYREDLLHEKQKVRLRNEQLEKQNLKMQLEVLQQQADPHFLFNTLNSLRILIRNRPEQAEAYTMELSNVYRYLLSHHKRETVSLSEEIDFIRSYLSLLDIRFGANFSTSIEIDPAYHSYSIVPLSLQILIENAVKHNVITEKNPLFLHIYSNDKRQIVVENRISRRLAGNAPGGYGLFHLSELFRLRLGKEVSVRENENRFYVYLPLTPSNSL